MKIRAMTRADAEEVWRMGKEEPTFQGFWPLSVIENLADSKAGDIAIVAEEDRKIIGFCLAAFHSLTRKIHWENLYVHPNHRGKKIGHQLILEFIRRCKVRKALLISAILINVDLHKELTSLGFKNIGNWYFFKLLTS